MKAQSPLLGFNNNVRHKGRVFHIQTEDSGIRHPHIITHLFADGGRILKTQKTSYAEHVGETSISETVRGMMQEQHKAMFIALRDGQFDHLFDEAGNAASDARQKAVARPPSPSAPAIALGPEPVPPPPSSPGEEDRPTVVDAIAAVSAPDGVEAEREDAATGSAEAKRRSNSRPKLVIDQASLLATPGEADALGRAKTAPPPPRPPSRTPPPPVRTHRTEPPVSSGDSSIDLDLDALERAAAEAQTHSPFMKPMQDLPPPPATLLGKKPPPGTYSAVTPAHGGRPSASASPPVAPASSAGRYAPSRPAAIFATTRPPEGASIFGEDLISEKSLDEVILSYLAEDLEGSEKK